MPQVKKVNKHKRKKWLGPGRSERILGDDDRKMVLFIRKRHTNATRIGPTAKKRVTLKKKMRCEGKKKKEPLGAEIGRCPRKIEVQISRSCGIYRGPKERKGEEVKRCVRTGGDEVGKAQPGPWEGIWARRGFGGVAALGGVRVWEGVRVCEERMRVVRTGLVFFGGFGGCRAGGGLVDASARGIVSRCECRLGFG